MKSLAYTPFRWTNGDTIGPLSDAALANVKAQAGLKVIQVGNVSHHVVYNEDEYTVNQENVNLLALVIHECEYLFLDWEAGDIPMQAWGYGIPSAVSAVMHARAFWGLYFDKPTGVYSFPVPKPVELSLTYVQKGHEPFIPHPAYLPGYTSLDHDDEYGNDYWNHYFAIFGKVHTLQKAGCKKVFVLIHPNTTKGVYAPSLFQAALQATRAAGGIPLLFMNPTAADLHPTKEGVDELYAWAIEEMAK